MQVRAGVIRFGLASCERLSDVFLSCIYSTPPHHFYWCHARFDQHKAPALFDLCALSDREQPTVRDVLPLGRSKTAVCPARQSSGTTINESIHILLLQVIHVLVVQGKYCRVLFHRRP